MHPVPHLPRGKSDPVWNLLLPPYSHSYLLQGTLRIASLKSSRRFRSLSRKLEVRKGICPFMRRSPLAPRSDQGIFSAVRAID